MTKKEIVKSISDKIGSTQLNTKRTVQMVFDAIIETLVLDGRIELRNFGVFEIKKRKARKARNPRTGDKVDVAEKFVVTFKPGKQMEDKVDRLRVALDRLPEADLQLILWRWFQRLNEKEIAKRLEVSVHEAEQRYARAQARLQAELSNLADVADDDESPQASRSVGSRATDAEDDVDDVDEAPVAGNQAARSASDNSGDASDARGEAASSQAPSSSAFHG